MSLNNIMPRCSGSEEWDRWKNAIQTLYILERRPLEGVMELMEARYSFTAKKSQYEKHFAMWGFKKKNTKEAWQIIKWKVDKRARAKKESNVYSDRKLLPADRLQKEISRHGHLSVMDQWKWAQAPSPRTPPRFQIRTPSDLSVDHLDFEDLPILQFQKTMPTFTEPFRSFDPGLGFVGSFLRQDRKNDNARSMLSVIGSLLPSSVLMCETQELDVAIGKYGQVGSMELLNLTVYLISNNFPAQSNGKEIYEWAKALGKQSLDVLQSMKGPSAEGLLEKLFRIAVETEDLPIVRSLVHAGIDPNQSCCMLEPCPDTLTPLQFACLKGNIELVKEMIEARSSIDEPGSGWKSSALVLAIFGHHIHFEYFNDADASRDSGDDSIVHHNDVLTNHLVDLAKCLIDAGASVNLVEDADSYQAAKSSRKWHLDPGDPMYPLVYEGHSALTAASKYRHEEVVALLIQKGANVWFRMGDGKGNSALRECLYSSEDLTYFFGIIKQPEPLSERLRHGIHFQGSNRRSRITGVARCLVDARADLNDHLPCNDDNDDIDFCKHYALQCHSPLDLAVSTGSTDLIEMMLRKGASATKHSLDIALEVRSFAIFNVLLNAGAPIPDWATSESDQLVCAFPSSITGPVSRNLEYLQRKRAGIIAAIRFGETTILDDLMRSVSGYSGNFLDNCTALADAIEDCCRHGYFEMLRRLLSGGIVDQSALAPFLSCSVYTAIENNHEELVDMLLKTDADVNEDSDHTASLLLAIRRRNSELVRRFLNAGARLNEERKCGAHKRHGDILVAAIESGVDVVDDIIREGADIDAPGSMMCIEFGCHCSTPLTVAILVENWVMVDWLLDADVDVNVPSGMLSGKTPLWAAVRRKNIVLTRSLLEAGARADDMHALAEATNDVELLKLLVSNMGAHSNRDNPSNIGQLALKKSIREKNLATARLILESGLVDVNALANDRVGNGTYSTPLHTALASDPGHRFEFTNLLLGWGADPNGIVYKDFSTTQSALLDAIDTKDPEVVRLLLEAGAKANREFEAGMLFSPVQNAAQKRSMDILRILLEENSDPNAVSPWGKSGTALQLATENQNLEMVTILVKHNANVNAVTGSLPHTPLQMAARDGCKEIVELLLEYGALANSPPAEEFGATALQFAAIGGYLGIACLLLERQADVNASPAKIEGRTALEGAGEHGRVDMVQLLINAGADISEEGEGQYERALIRASKNGHYATRRLLASYLS